ncbi:MAG TPA: respiratory nitrate reductase subunit gamma, partial [Gammaproteobacteria bacterium]|nr:respiratory nitrate reductase subunit gamma [Gammaproteobacteria bacterium]
HQKIAIVAGIIFGGMCLVGATMLIMRRLKDPRIVATSRKRDLLVIGWLLATVIVGLLTTLVSMNHVSHGDASTMIALTSYVQSVATLQADPSLLTDVNPIFKFHMLLGMTVFLIFPFTRLVHIWSVPLTYLSRAYQIVRTKYVTAR